MKKLLLCAVLIAGYQAQTFCSEPKPKMTFTSKALSKISSLSKNIFMSMGHGSVTVASAIAAYYSSLQAVEAAQMLINLPASFLSLNNASNSLSLKQSVVAALVAAGFSMTKIYSIASAVTGSVIAGALVKFSAKQTFDSLRKVVTLAD